MQTATVDLLDIDPFELVADEAPWGGSTEPGAEVSRGAEEH